MQSFVRDSQREIDFVSASEEKNVEIGFLMRLVLARQVYFGEGFSKLIVAGALRCVVQKFRPFSRTSCCLLVLLRAYRRRTCMTSPEIESLNKPKQ